MCGYFVILVIAVDRLSPGCESEPELVIVAVLVTSVPTEPVAWTFISIVYSAMSNKSVTPRDCSVQVTVLLA